MKFNAAKAATRILVPILFLLIGLCAGRILFHAPPRSVDAALQSARSVCERELHDNADFSQLKLNLCASFLRRLAEMELDWRRADVENRPDYARIEAEYLEWSRAWDRMIEENRAAPSDFAGGSLEMTDFAMREYALLSEQLAELETRWRGDE